MGTISNGSRMPCDPEGVLTLPGIYVQECDRSVKLKSPQIMRNSALTAKQKSAIRRLIAAKSDREIARLLRQTHRRLNLHQRPRSRISHRERWLDYELQLLGRMRDEELARFLRRSPGAVAAKRESLGIAIFAPRRTAWSPREIELLGKRPDPIVARMLGRTKFAVQLKRHSLGIPQCWENRRAWTEEENRLLGTGRDQEVAKRLGRSVSSVRSHRNEQTSIRFIKTPRRWTAAELRFLGRVNDAEAARQTGRLLASVRNKRMQLGIPRCVLKKNRR